MIEGVIREAQQGTVEDWARESLLAARQAYQEPMTGRGIKAGTKLGDAHQEMSVPVAKRRLYQAGARLASTLRHIGAFGLHPGVD